MMRFLFFILFLFQFTSFNAQSLISKFTRISRPEKCWVLSHPFVAKRAFKATIRSYFITDSIKNSGTIGDDMSGGKMDAFKHAYWIACVTKAIGSRKALKLGKAHEKGNKLQFKKHELEDKILPDSISSVMDLLNNEQGAAVAKDKQLSETQLQQKIMELLLQGKLACIRKDKRGNYLTCNGELIDLHQWFGKWGVPKCLIKSNEN
jgi:hypothetical protein